MSKESKLKALFEKSMESGGLQGFRANWEQSLGIKNVDGVNKLTNEKEVDYKEFEIGRACSALLGADWRTKFEQNWMPASRMRFESQGGSVMTGDLPYVSAALDVIAGLANARALERPLSPIFIADQMCSTVEAAGEGGWDIIVRPTGQLPADDLADGQAIPTVTLKGSRVHRNRTRNQGLRAKVNLYTILDDLTGTLYSAIDEVADMVLYEKERKVADCLMGIYDGKYESGIKMEQDGVAWMPYQATAVTTGAPENNAKVRNYANCVNADGKGLVDYTCVERAYNLLYNNRDPFTNLPVNISLQGMKMFVAPRSLIQAKYILDARETWATSDIGFTTAYAKNTISGNPLSGMGISLVSSQIWANRLVDVGLGANGLGVAAGGALTTATADTTHTATSVASFFMLGHPERAIKYLQRQPYTVTQVPLGSMEYADQTVLIQDFRERGQAYWVEPRVMYRVYA